MVATLVVALLALVPSAAAQTSTPSLDIRKQSPGLDTRTVARGSTVSYTIRVQNTGSVTIENTQVVDPQVPACDRVIGTLAAGAVVSYTCSVANVQQGFTNQACVIGRGVSGGKAGDCDRSRIVIAAAAFIVIDEDGIDNGLRPNFFSARDVNDDIAEIGVRTPLRFFQANIGRQIVLYTGQVGDEGWFAPETIPSSWNAAGPTCSGLRNFLRAGPGLGSGSDREALLDKVPNVNPLRATGLRLLTGRTVCAVVYDSDISINYGPLNGSLKGANLGIVAFTVNRVEQLTGFSSSTLPKVTLTIRDARSVCDGPVSLFTAAPEPTSSSTPFDIVP